MTEKVPENPEAKMSRKEMKAEFGRLTRELQIALEAFKKTEKQPTSGSLDELLDKYAQAGQIHRNMLPTYNRWLELRKKLREGK